MSDKNMDDLLAQLKNEFEPKQKASSQQSKAQPPQSTSKGSMEEMLSELREELESEEEDQILPPANRQFQLNQTRRLRILLRIVNTSTP